MIRSRVRKNTKPPLRRTIGVALLICGGLLVAGCADSPPVEQAAGPVEDDARQVIARARKLIQGAVGNYGLNETGVHKIEQLPADLLADVERT